MISSPDEYILLSAGAMIYVDGSRIINVSLDNQIYVNDGSPFLDYILIRKADMA
jgi:hypothetical protein